MIYIFLINNFIPSHLFSQVGGKKEDKYDLIIIHEEIYKLIWSSRRDNRLYKHLI